MTKIGIVVLALATGCAGMMGSQKQDEKKSGTMTAQDQAATSFQRAADAQKKANEAQAQAEKADRDVDNAQKALADARLRARGLHSKAEQAQADAQEAASQAQQQGSQAQQQALQTQSQEMKSHEQQVNRNNTAWTTEKTVSGQLLQSKDNQLLLRTAGRKDMNLDLNDSTAIQIDGKAGSASQLQPGSDVRASYQLVDGKAKALKVDVTSNDGVGSSSSSGKTSDPADQGATQQAPSDRPASEGVQK